MMSKLKSLEQEHQRLLSSHNQTEVSSTACDKLCSTYMCLVSLSITYVSVCISPKIMLRDISCVPYCLCHNSNYIRTLVA